MTPSALLDFLPVDVFIAFAVFCRVGALFMTAPAFGDFSLSPRLRLAAALAVALVLAPVHDTHIFVSMYLYEKIHTPRAAVSEGQCVCLHAASYKLSQKKYHGWNVQANVMDPTPNVSTIIKLKLS